MNLGKRDRLITLLAPQAVGQNAYGEEAPAIFAPPTIGQEWAQVKYPTNNGGGGGGGEDYQANQQTATQAATFTIRYRPDVAATWQLEHDGRTYHITAVAEVGRRQGLIITAYTRNNNDGQQ